MARNMVSIKEMRVACLTPHKETETSVLQLHELNLNRKNELGT